MVIKTLLLFIGGFIDLTHPTTVGVNEIDEEIVFEAPSEFEHYLFGSFSSGGGSTE